MGAETHRELPPVRVSAIRAVGASRCTIRRHALDPFRAIACAEDARLQQLDALPVPGVRQGRVARLLDVPHDSSGSGAARAVPVVWRL